MTKKLKRNGFGILFRWVFVSGRFYSCVADSAHRNKNARTETEGKKRSGLNRMVKPLLVAGEGFEPSTFGL